VQESTRATGNLLQLEKPARKEVRWLNQTNKLTISPTASILTSRRGRHRRQGVRHPHSPSSAPQRTLMTSASDRPQAPGSTKLTQRRPTGRNKEAAPTSETARRSSIANEKMIWERLSNATRRQNFQKVEMYDFGRTAENVEDVTRGGKLLHLKAS